jgi:hypothetical protein
MKLNCGAERHHYSTCPQCLEAGAGKLKNLIHNSMITLTQRTMHGRRVFNVGRSMFIFKKS